MLLRSAPMSPVPFAPLILSVLGLWLLPVPLGILGQLLAVLVGKIWPEPALLGWTFATVLTFSPLASWMGWLLALPAVWLALRAGWFGWASAVLIGAVAGASAGALADIEIALPFGVLALLALRAALPRALTGFR